jgi:rhodanese-related sulfurtransferase
VEQVPENYTLASFRTWVDRSRRNLGVERLDLVQLHCPPTSVYSHDAVYDALDTLVVDGAIAISSGTLPVVADTEVPEEWRDPRLQDRSRPVITVCELGPMSALAAKTLKDMGFEHVAYLEGGTQAWKDAGLPTTPPSDE